MKSCLIIATAFVFGDTAQTYQNPLVVENMPDPGVLRLSDGSYVLVSTSNYSSDPSKNDAFPIRHSKDLVTWEEKGFLFPHGEWPEWASRDMWAPELHLVDGCYRAFFTGRNKDTGALSIGTAVNCDTPYGPFKDNGKPLH